MKQKGRAILYKWLRLFADAIHEPIDSNRCCHIYIQRNPTDLFYTGSGSTVFSKNGKNTRKIVPKNVEIQKRSFLKMLTLAVRRVRLSS